MVGVEKDGRDLGDVASLTDLNYGSGQRKN